MNYWVSSYIISRGGKQTERAYTYEIHATKGWSNVGKVYEGVFNSYSMGLNAFKHQSQVRLSEYNDNERGYVYYIDNDARHYYRATDAIRLKGVESVTINVTCSDSITLGQSSTQYKCRECGGSLDTHSKECAMKTSVSESDLDLSELDEKERETNSEIAPLEVQISQLETENRNLLTQIANASVEEAPTLRQWYNVNKTKIDNLKKGSATWQQQLTDIQGAKSETANNSAIPTNNYYRIPAIMQDVKSTCNPTQQGVGSWNGYAYVRTAIMPDVSGIVAFKATLSITGKPKYFLGIKIHRAILQISWELTSEYTDTQVVDVLTLDPNVSDEEKAGRMSSHISKTAQEFPSCNITTEYAKSEATRTVNNDSTIHLLRSNGHLGVAREVDGRITKIYVDLVPLEKMMHYKRGIIGVLRSIPPSIGTDQSRRRMLIEGCYKRWGENTNPSRGSGKDSENEN